MLVLIVQRLLLSVIVLIGVTLIIFSLLFLAPGDPVRSWVGPTATPEQVEQARERLGLDEPVPVQYVRWLSRVSSGSFGRSIQFSIPVGPLLFERMKNSMILIGASLAFAVPVGFALGYIAAPRRLSLTDRWITFISLLGASLPVYWLGLVLLLVFALKLGWFPGSGMCSLTGDNDTPDLIHHLVLPAVTAGAVPASVIARMVRALMMGNLKEDYVLQLRAKGLRQQQVMRHVLRNSMPGAINVTGLQVAYLLGAIVFTEVVFSWPGIGLSLLNGILARDIPLVQGGVLLVAGAFVLVNLATDVVALALDPRRQ